MAIKSSKYKTPMLPYQTLSRFGKQIKIGKPNLRLFYFVAGEENPENLLLIHGLGDEADTWRHVINPLSERFRVFALDLPGFGRSEKPNIDYTPELFSKTIIQFMDQLEINNAILIGSSLGGILSHHFAINHPERVKGLILVGGSLLQPKAMLDLRLIIMSLPIIGKWLYTSLRKDSDKAYATLNNVYYRIHEMPDSDRTFLYNRVNQRVWDDGQRRAYLSTLRKMGPWIKQRQKSLPNQLKNLQIPTLVIRGEKDRLFLEETAQSIIDIQPEAKKATIPNTGHLPQQEDPHAFLEIVTNWINENI